MDLGSWITPLSLLLSAGVGFGGWMTSRANRGLIIANIRKSEIEAAVAMIEQLRIERDRYERKWAECVAQREADGRMFASREETFNRERKEVWERAESEARARLDALRRETEGVAAAKSKP